MPQECPERKRLTQKVAEAADALYALRDRMDVDYTELIQARSAKRQATEALEAHVKEHGCEA